MCVCEALFKEIDHLLLYPNPEVNKVFNYGVKTVKVTLEEKDTEPDLKKAILGALKMI